MNYFETTLPVGWARTTLSQICWKITDGSHNPPPKAQVGLPMLSAVNVSGNRIVFGQHRLISDEDFEREDLRTSVSPGDVLLTIVGTIGRSAVVPVKTPRLTLQRSVAVLKPIEVDPTFIMYQLESAKTNRYLNDNAKGTAQKGIYLRNLGFTPFLLPPLNEQRRIVEKIETLFAQLDKGEEAVRQVQKLLNRYRQSVLKSAVTGELTADWRSERADQLKPSQNLLVQILQTRREKWAARRKYEEPKAVALTDLPMLPEIWLWTNMDALIVHGPQNGLYLPQNKYGDGTPIIRIDDFQTGWVRPIKNLRRVRATPEEIILHSLKNGDFVINRVNSVSHLGKTMLVDAEHEGALFESNMMRLSVSDRVDRSFLELYLSSSIGRKRLIANCKHAVNQASINQGDVAATAVPLPPLEEQQEIVVLAKERLARAEVLVEWCDAELKRSASLRQSILKDAFAGKLVPQDPADEPASALLARIATAQPIARKARRKTSA
ncbi:hypothetical protein ELI20_01095 [Rhizobium ruizarguesonis]|uniref:restriction endonuclease subunit S n=1 Tax=Rhizobium ruizarguesonis TaxID=2081791 RepID=UPI00102F38C2|nr:restriction endonuclease subunit S [Rhizobium ruizarguesonis]TAW19913.1 hypothetical protein ELI20_01095 [Rhizobium ruizarguesonis]